MQMALLNIIHDGAQWNVAVLHPLARMSLINDRTPKTTHLAKLQAVILTLDALTNKWSHLHVYYKLVGIA